MSGNETGANVEASARNLLQRVPISGTKIAKPFCKLYSVQVVKIYDTL